MRQFLEENRDLKESLVPQWERLQEVQEQHGQQINSLTDRVDELEKKSNTSGRSCCFYHAVWTHTVIFLSHSQELREDVLKKKPKKPKRDEYETEEEFASAAEKYEIECENYKQYVGWAMSVVRKLMEWIGDLFKTIKAFFKDLWNWIKNAFANIAQRVQHFVEFVGEKISGLYKDLFG